MRLVCRAVDRLRLVLIHCDQGHQNLEQETVGPVGSWADHLDYRSGIVRKSEKTACYGENSAVQNQDGK